MSADRRDFLTWVLGLSGGALMAAAVYPVVRFLSPPHLPEAVTQSVEAGSVDDPELRDKGFKIVRFGEDPVIVLDAGDGEYRAFAATCTHLDCIVEFRRPERVIWCNCHNGVFDLAGRNVAGPPPRPLEPFRVRVVERGGQPALLMVERA